MILARAIAAVLLSLGHLSPAHDPARARELIRAGLDQEAALDLDSALALYRAARRADSSDVEAEFRYVTLRRERFEYAALRTEYSARAGRWTPHSTNCLGPLVTPVLEGRSVAEQVLRADPTGTATPCSAAVTLIAIEDPTPAADVAIRRAAGRRAVQALPTVTDVWTSYATLLAEGSDTAALDAAWRAGENAAGHPLLRVRMEMWHATSLLARGDTAAARAMQAAARATAARDGRPGVRVAYLSFVRRAPALAAADGGEVDIVEKTLALSARRGGWPVAAAALTECAKGLIDAGEPLKALPYLARAIALADSVDVSDLQLVARTLRGRAYTKAGRPAEAERDLQKALVAGARAGVAWYRADAFHNLAHTYESEGRWVEAARTIDTFTVLAQRMSSGPEITALLDAGEIRWKAGWHASADLAFRQMVRAIDSTHGNYYFAGEYFERAGNLDRARDYYARAVQAAGSDPAGFAGMSRVHAALGHADSAETWARAHDAMIVRWQPLDLPMLPMTLARNGRTSEAMRIAHAWATRQIKEGNVEGAALATLQVAQLLLDAGHADTAFTESERVDSIVGTLNFAREAIRARVVRGTALVRLGRSAAGVRVLDSALAAAERHPSRDDLVDAHEALGEAFVSTGETESALREFDLAALAVEHETADLSGDLDRAGYRERNLRPFDGALRLLRSMKPDGERADDFLRWISRRNAAALALDAADSSGPSTRARPRSAVPATPGLAELRARLAGDDALLSYLVLDSTVSAIVVTRTSARIARLPIDARTLAARIDAIRRPLVTTYSGRLDLARATYSTSAAAELYAALIAPFAHELTGKRRLLIAPDGALHSLSFDALVAQPGTAPATAATGAIRVQPDYRALHYLIDAFEVEYLPSPAFLPAPGDRARFGRLGGMRLLAVGYGAPGSSAEIRAFRDVWPRRSYAVLDSTSATTRAVKSRMRQFAILHFAVHATADTHDPLASYLQLVPDSANDGFLHTADIADSHIHAELVVLSACETNAGPIYGGEGAMGIARAFLAGGAHAVVATQWPIGAEAAGLMKEFYQRMARGETPASALRAAKLTVRRSEQGAHPVHWAGFELVR